MISQLHEYANRVISLDIQTDVNATTGEIRGIAIQPTIRLTLVFHKMGLVVEEPHVYLGDKGIHVEHYPRRGIVFQSFFKNRCWIPLQRKSAIDEGN